jgi:hypothetical protein
MCDIFTLRLSNTTRFKLEVLSTTHFQNRWFRSPTQPRERTVGNPQGKANIARGYVRNLLHTRQQSANAVASDFRPEGLG